MASTVPNSKLCLNCNVAPAFSGYDYCSRSCGREARNGGGSHTAPPPFYANQSYSDDYVDEYGDDMRGTTTSEYEDDLDPTMCIQCQARPKFGGHDYCGRTCGRNARNGVPPASRQSSADQNNSPTFDVSPHSFNLRQPTLAPCKIPSCGRSEESKGGGYCSQSHRKQGVTSGIDPGCLMCKVLPRAGDRGHFCSDTCAKKAMRNAPTLLEVPMNNPRFADVAGQFKTAWKHTANPPRVARVYKIILPQSSLDTYEAYKARIESVGDFSKKGMQVANERRRWHGTRRQCKIGDDPNSFKPCSSSTCAVCMILKGSYDVKYAAIGMFGKGIYTSATSSKSDTYTRGATPGSPYKAMFLNRVAVGKGKILTTADNTLRTAPAGFDSIIANPGSGLNYDELIVYDNAAIRPSWLLLYEGGK